MQPSDNKLIVLLLGNSAFKTRAVMKMRLELIGSIVLFLFWIPRIQNVLHIDGISRERDGLWESPWPRQ